MHSKFHAISQCVPPSAICKTLHKLKTFLVFTPRKIYLSTRRHQMTFLAQKDFHTMHPSTNHEMTSRLNKMVPNMKISGNNSVKKSDQQKKIDSFIQRSPISR